MRMRCTTLLCVFWLASVLLLTAVAQAAAPSDATTQKPLLKQGNARVILIGDSITGQSRNHPAGFAHQMDWALKEAYPGCHADIVSLGGSGAGINAWLDFERRSREKPLFLDVKGLDVKAELARPADVVVIMLGMNDILAPYVNEKPESIQHWANQYRELIHAIRTRNKPGVIALATITPCTEDLNSPKNRVRQLLNRQVAALAKEEQCPLFATGDKVERILCVGRRLRSDFHVTHDFVHPNEAGHLAIAEAMLHGMGETAAVQKIQTRLLALLETAPVRWPAFSYELTPLRPFLIPDADCEIFGMQHRWIASKNQLMEELAGGIENKERTTLRWASEDEIYVTHRSRENVVTYSTKNKDGKEVEEDVKICAPWLVAVGPAQPFWSNMRFDPSKANTPIDDALRQNKSRISVPMPPTGKPLQWQQWFPSVNYTGQNTPGSVDFAGVAFFENFQVGYGVQWIDSSRERSARLACSTETFAGDMFLTVFVNGREVYAGQLTAEPGKRKLVDVQLHRGWNTLAFKSNHCTWQWQCTVTLTPSDGDKLDDLRYSTTPHEDAFPNIMKTGHKR